MNNTPKKSFSTRELQTTVKPWNKRKMGHVGVPIELLGHKVAVMLLDSDVIPIEKYVTAYGNGSHVLVSNQWIGRDVIVSLLD
jgi:putative transposon-encoded protein